MELAQKLWAELPCRLKNDAQYQEYMDLMNALEPAMDEIRSCLTPTQQDQLDNYIRAVEAADDCMTYLAYLIGLEQGRAERPLTVIHPGRD